MIYVDRNGALYDGAYLPLNVAVPAAIPFPSPQAFQGESEFLDAVNEWVKIVSLQKFILPVGVSRVYCRPRFEPNSKIMSVSSGADDTGTDEASETATPDSMSPRSMRSPFISPRAALSPRSGAVSPRPGASLPPELVQPHSQRGAWRATLIPAVPATDNEEVLARWARLVQEQCPSLPPHPRELADLLGIRNRLLLDPSSDGSGSVAEGKSVGDGGGAVTLSASAAASTAASTALVAQPSPLVARSKRESLWMRGVVAAERGLLGQPAPQAAARASLLAKLAEEAKAAPPLERRSVVVPLHLTKQVAKVTPLRGATPILSRIRPSTPQQRRLPAAPMAPPIASLGARPRTSTSERIAVVDLFDSDDEDSDSVAAGSEQASEQEEGEEDGEKETAPPATAVALLLSIEPVPDVGKIGSAKAVAQARLRACRLLGNLFVKRSLRALERHENFYCVPVTARIKACQLLPSYPSLFARQGGQQQQLIDVAQRSNVYRLRGNDKFEETLLDRAPTNAHLIPETEIFLDLSLLKTDESYLEVKGSEI